MIELRKWCFDRVLTERNVIMMNMREEAPLDDFHRDASDFRKNQRLGSYWRSYIFVSIRASSI